MLRARVVRRDERQIDVGRRLLRQVFLGPLRRFLQPLECHLILAQVDVVFLLELFGDVVDQHLIEVVAAEMRIAVDALHFEDAVAHIKDGDVERAAAEIEHRDALVFLIELICQRGGGRLVDDAHPLLFLAASRGVFDLPFGVEAGDTGCFKSRLPLSIVEIRRHGDHRLADSLSQIGFGRFFQLAQDHCADFGGRVRLAVDVDLGRIVAVAGDLVRDQLFFVDAFLAPGAP